MQSIIHYQGVETAGKSIRTNTCSIATQNSDPADQDGWAIDYRYLAPCDRTPNVQPASMRQALSGAGSAMSGPA